MISRYEVILNGQPLSEVSEYILILDISYPPASIDFSKYRNAKRNGNRIYREYVDHRDVVVTFAIRAYSVQTRQAVCNDIQRWAKNGGILKTNDHVGQRLRCVLSSPPTIQSALKWTDPITMTFTAYALPFWEEDTPATVTLSGTDIRGSLTVPGSVDGGCFEVDAYPSGVLTSLTLMANNKILLLSGLSVESGTKVSISYDDNMIMSIKAGYSSILDKRTGVDDLPIKSGEINSVAFVSNVPCDVTFKGRGLWS